MGGPGTPVFVPSFRFWESRIILQNHPFGNHPFANPRQVELKRPSTQTFQELPQFLLRLLQNFQRIRKLLPLPASIEWRRPWHSSPRAKLIFTSPSPTPKHVPPLTPPLEGFRSLHAVLRTPIKIVDLCLEPFDRECQLWRRFGGAVSKGPKMGLNSVWLQAS